MADSSLNPARLPDGGAIDRTRPIDFTFNGKSYRGFAGDTLASALLANRVSVVARSFKYHRPRGIFSAGEEEPCALVDVETAERRIPNCRATLVNLEPGLVANSLDGWPSVDRDLGRVFDWTHGLWPAGFYNKTFKWPRWRTWEGMVRRMAGLGEAPEGFDPDRYEQVNVHCDLLICGGGPFGLINALVAAHAGLRVILAEQTDGLGGALNSGSFILDDAPAEEWVRSVVPQLTALPNVTVLTGTVVSGLYDHGVTTLLQSGSGAAWRECLWTVRPRHIVLATGAIEQGQIFPSNDRPGIMLASAARHYLQRFAVCAGEPVVVSTSNDSAYQAVFDFQRRGVEVAAVVDNRRNPNPALAEKLRNAGVELFESARVGGTRGNRRITHVEIRANDGRRLAVRRCDLLAVSGGWAPRIHLLAHARGTLRFDSATQSFVPDRVPDFISVTGDAGGVSSLAGEWLQARDRAERLVSRLGATARSVQLPAVTGEPVPQGEVSPAGYLHSRKRQWIDLAHDVTLQDAELAVREGMTSVEHFKRYTTTGMSVDQGKTGNINAFSVLAKLTGRDTGEVGTTTFRPPYTPVTLGAVAGRETGDFYAIRRYLPAHLTHVDIGARFEDYGWLRPDFYARVDESPESAIRREALTVRKHVGVFDNSPIGKLEVRGPDAAEFLERCTINRIETLQPGRCRYGLMLNDEGVLFDDGVISRIAFDHFLVNTTSAGVSRVRELMEQRLQCDWPSLRAVVDDVTEQWANFTIAGPSARKVMGSLNLDISLGRDDLPHMAMTECRLDGVAARLLRVSFSGELSFELNVPAGQANRVLRRLLEAGRPHQAAPYGVEALMLLRLEKGFFHIGSDTDGSTTPDDVGWGRVARSRSGDFIGRRSLDRPAQLDAVRRQLVGIEAVETEQPLRPGAHLLGGAARRPPARTEGWITSAAFSPVCRRFIALAMLENGRARHGERLTACDEDQCYPVRVVDPVFYDPGNERLEV